MIKQYTIENKSAYARPEHLARIYAVKIKISELIRPDQGASYNAINEAS